MNFDHQQASTIHCSKRALATSISKNMPTASNGVLTKQQIERLGDVTKALISLNNSAAPQGNLVLAAFTTLVSLHVGCKAEMAAI
jgi:hypothetical protein